MSKYLISVAAILLFFGCNSGSVETPSKNYIRVEMFGDSITNQAGLTIKEFLPSREIINHGSDGTMAKDMILPPWNKETIYTVSYGTNECLNKISVLEYKSALNHIIVMSSGYSLILEAPWRVVDPRCNPDIELYRQAVVDLGLQYNVPVVTENNQDHIGEGIHLTQAHTRERARLLSIEILKF